MYCCGAVNKVYCIKKIHNGHQLVGYVFGFHRHGVNKTHGKLNKTYKLYSPVWIANKE